MTTEERTTRDADSWARHQGPLTVGHAPDGALNLNVDGRELAGPMQGFGKLWQKTYRVALAGAATTPQEVIAAWKANYGEFWPDGNNFYAPLAGIEPGEIGLINADMPGGMKLSTGVMVLYADDVSFTYMTPLGHPFAGWITFSAEDHDGTTHAQVEVLMRATDPASEVGLALGGHRTEDRMWQHTLVNLAAHFGVDGATVDTQVVCVDKRRQWDRVGNIRHDAVLHTAVHLLGAPVRAVGMSWRGLLSAAVTTNVVAQLGFMAVIGVVVPPLAILAVVMVVGLAVATRREPVGGGIAAVAGILQLIGAAPFVVPALEFLASPVDFIHAAATLLAGITVTVAGLALVRRRTGAPRRLALGGAAVVTLAVVGSLVAALATPSDTLDRGEVEVATVDATFVPATVTATAGDTLHVVNRDPYAHTFTVAALGIDVDLPSSTARDTVLVGATPGSYTITCEIPGHETMTATLEVTP